MSRSTGRGTTRTSGRRLDLTILLAVVLPLLTAGALALVRPDDRSAVTVQAPTETLLSQAVAICPSGRPEALVATGTDAGGAVDFVLGDREGTTDVEPGRVSTITGGDGPLVARAQGDLAPGLVAGRFAEPLAAAECRAPAAEQWFTGVGSGARHTSVLELVNPDAGPAVVDATLYGVGGVVDAPDLRGVAVPGRGVVRLTLGELVPRRDELALHVTTSRGRVTASLVDRYQQLGTGGASEDWLPAQSEPATSNLVLGMAPGSGLRTLSLLNPGDDETRATVRLVSQESVFAPAGLEDVVLAPQSVTRVSLTSLMREEASRGTLGLLVESPDPITASVRAYLDGDLSHAVTGTPISSETTLLAPVGDKQVVLAGASGPGAVSVTARSADGEVLAEERIEVVPGRGFTVDLPRRAVLLTVTPARTDVVGSVLVSDDQGATVLRLRQPVTSGLVASVRPGLS